jgi:hypothetical protein
LKQRKGIRPVSKMLHELERAEEVDEDEDDKGEKARRIESVRGGRSWGEDEPAQCLSRPVGSVIPFVVICFQSGNIFHAVTVALLQAASRTAYEGGGSEGLHQEDVIHYGTLKTTTEYSVVKSNSLM